MSLAVPPWRPLRSARGSNTSSAGRRSRPGCSSAMSSRISRRKCNPSPPWQAMCMTSPHDSLIHAAVARQAARDPDAIALVWQDCEISYGILEAAATGYAADLSDRGVGPGQIVPLLMDRSPEMVALQLGVLKTGAAYA